MITRGAAPLYVLCVSVVKSVAYVNDLNTTRAGAPSAPFSLSGSAINS